MGCTSKHTILHIRPPYTPESRASVELRELGSVAVVPGLVMAVRVSTWSEWEVLRQEFPSARWKVPAAPFVLWTPAVFEERPRVGFEAAGIGFRGVTAHESLARQALLEALGEEVDLAAVIGWIGQRTSGGKRKRLDDVRLLLAAGLSGQGFQECCAQAFVEPSALQVRLRRAGWVAPTDFLRFGRLAATLPLVQSADPLREPAGRAAPTIETIARSGGFTDGSHLRHEYRHFVGHPPSAFTGTLGWEYVVDRALRRLVR